MRPTGTSKEKTGSGQEGFQNGKRIGRDMRTRGVVKEKGEWGPSKG